MKNNQITLSIVIPCYNEEKNIPVLLKKFSKVVRGKSIEVILVDNGSGDRTGDVLSRLLPRYSFARTLKVKKNIGYGRGILKGLREARGDYLGWTHADLQTDPKDVVRALEIIKDAHREDLFIKGWRKRRAIFDSCFSACMGIYVSLALGKIFREVNAQPTIFSRKLYNKFGSAPKDFSLDLYVYYLAKVEKQHIVRLNVLFPERLHGQSSWNTSFKNRVKLTLRAMRYTKELKQRFK